MPQRFSGRTMALLLDWMLQPLGMVFMLLLAGLLFLWNKAAKARVTTLCLFLGTLILWVSSAPVTANALVKQLETLDSKSIEACSAVERTSPVVVLGAGIDAYVDSDNPYEVLSRSSLLRTVHALSLDEDEHSFYLLGGGQTARKLSDYMSRLLISNGIADSRIVVENKSLSTVENARQLSAILSPDEAGPIRLVTSYLHGNRAAATFSAQGFRVCTVPVDPLYSVSAGWVGFLPYLDALAKSTEAWREIMAITLYRWRGYTDAL